MQKAHGDNISVDRAGIYYINVPFRERLDMLITLGVLQPHEDNNLSQKKGKSPIFTLEISQKSDFQHSTMKPDNIDHPTIKTGQIWPLGWF